MRTASVPKMRVTEMFVGLPYDSGGSDPGDREAWDDFWLDFGDSFAAGPMPAIPDGATRVTSSSGEPTPAPEVHVGQDNDSGMDRDGAGFESACAGVSGERGWLELALAGDGAANQAASDQYFADFYC